MWPVCRYGEQKFRLKRCGVENVIYLVEGKMSGASRSQGVAALKTAMLMCKVKRRDSNAKPMRVCIILVIFRTATIVASDIRGSHHTQHTTAQHHNTTTPHQNTNTTQSPPLNSTRFMGGVLAGEGRFYGAAHASHQCIYRLPRARAPRYWGEDPSPNPQVLQYDNQWPIRTTVVSGLQWVGRWQGSMLMDLKK